jgi:hypothetical protein
MNRENAMHVTEEFLNQFTLERPEYWDGYGTEEVSPKVTCQCAAKGEAEREIVIYFSIPDGESETDPELIDLAKRAMVALYAAHPELKSLDIRWELST